MGAIRKIILGAVAIMSLMAGIAPAFADHVKKSDNQEFNNHGNNNRTNIIRIDDNDRPVLRQYAQDHYKKYCAPSVTKKYNECLRYREPQKRYVVGYALPDHILYYPVPRDIVARLHPVPKGYRYVRVDNDVVVIETASRQIMDVVVLPTSGSK